MARFFRKLANYLRPRTAGYGGTILSFSALTSFKEKDLKPVDEALKLENFPEKWSHKFLLQQSRQVELVCWLMVSQEM